MGFVTAGGVGWFSIKWLMAYVNKHSLNVFAGYCGFLGVACLAAHYLLI